MPICSAFSFGNFFIGCNCVNFLCIKFCICLLFISRTIVFVVLHTCLKCLHKAWKTTSFMNRNSHWFVWIIVSNKEILLLHIFWIILEDNFKLLPENLNPKSKPTALHCSDPLPWNLHRLISSISPAYSRRRWPASIEEGEVTGTSGPYGPIVSWTNGDPSGSPCC
jgi:hypothetical protein